MGECKSINQNARFSNELNSMRIKHIIKTVFAHLNIISLMNKFEFLPEFVKGKVDVLIMISETKIYNQHWPQRANSKLMVFIHHFVLIAIAAVRLLCFSLGKCTSKTDRLWKTSNRRFLCRNDLRKLKWLSISQQRTNHTGWKWKDYYW